jgi:V-type H+-transporting ATPase subunit H
VNLHLLSCNYLRVVCLCVQVLRILITLLDNSRDPKTLAVACHDIAQFIQLHPAGRGIILDLKAKERVMKHMSSPDPEVAKQALLCVQKILLSAKYASYMQ